MKNALSVKVSLAEFTEVIFLMARYDRVFINIEFFFSSVVALLANNIIRLLLILEEACDMN